VFEEYPYILVSTLFAIISLCYLFYVSPFRQTQVALLYILFSFQIRPLATGLCNDFSSFYFFTEKLYIDGVVYSSIMITIVSVVCALGYRPNHPVVSVDTLSLKRLNNLLLLLCFVFVSLALIIFGTSILPGFRTAGLSKSAPGSQIFFAITSVFAMFGVAITVFLYLSRRATLKNSMVTFLGYFFLVMVFNQRGALIGGIFIGLYISGFVGRAYIFRNVKDKLIIFVSILVVATYARPAIQSVVEFFVDTNPHSVSALNIEDNRSLACKIARKPNQEHDQVWPVILMFESEHGSDYYNNIFSSIFRSFLSAEERMSNNLMTAVDTLNIYNDKDTYLSKNFGFSIPGVLYQYYSVGLLFFFTLPMIFYICTFIENKIKIYELNEKTIFKFVIVNQVVVLLVNAWDERLKWFVITIVLMFLVCYPLFNLYNRWLSRHGN